MAVCSVGCHMDVMSWTGGHAFAQIGGEDQAGHCLRPYPGSRPGSWPDPLHRHGQEGGVDNGDRPALIRGHQPVRAIGHAPQHAGEKFDQFRAADRSPVMVPDPFGINGDPVIVQSRQGGCVRRLAGIAVWGHHVQ